MSLDTGQRMRSEFLCSGRSCEDGALSPAQRLDEAMLRLVWLEQKRWAQILAVHGITMSQFLVLAAVWERQEACRMGELAGEMLQSSATMTGIVERLVRMELVQRQAVATDRRLVHIDLTARGRELLLRVRSEKLDRTQRALDRLPEADRSALIRLISVYLELSDE